MGSPARVRGILSERMELSQGILCVLCASSEAGGEHLWFIENDEFSV